MPGGLRKPRLQCSKALDGGVVLFFYGIVPTYQAAHFGRVYTAYGGWFVVLSILWGWGIDRVTPDRYDILGAVVCLVGVAVSPTRRHCLHRHTAWCWHGPQTSGLSETRRYGTARRDGSGGAAAMCRCV